MVYDCGCTPKDYLEGTEHYLRSELSSNGIVGMSDGVGSIAKYAFHLITWTKWAYCVNCVCEIHLIFSKPLKFPAHAEGNRKNSGGSSCVTQKWILHWTEQQVTMVFKTKAWPCRHLQPVAHYKLGSNSQKFKFGQFSLLLNEGLDLLYLLLTLPCVCTNISQTYQNQLHIPL